MTFAEFDVDPAAGVLRRNGDRVKLQDLPFRLLVILLRRSGASVTRDELRAELWGAATFVDAEAGLNTAIAKLREALGDDPAAPRFIETLPKRGYRFIGTLAPDAIPDATPHAVPAAIAPTRGTLRPWLLVAAGLAAMAIAFAGYRAARGPAPITIAVVRFHNETGSADNDRLVGSLTDAVVVALADNPRYAVIGNSPLLRTERIFEDVRTIGDALHAEYVVLGQLQSVDRALVARAHFIRVSDQTHLWAGKIDLAGVADIERAVTTAVTAGLTTGLARRLP